MSRYKNPVSPDVAKRADRLTFDELHPIARALCKRKNITDWTKLLVRAVETSDRSEWPLNYATPCDSDSINAIIYENKDVISGLVFTNNHGMAQSTYHVQLSSAASTQAITEEVA